MRKTVGIISIKPETAKEFFNNLIGEMKYKNIKNVIIRNNDCYAELTDGTVYKTVPSSDSARGHRFTDLYLQNGLDREFIDCIAMPFLMPHDDGSDPAVMYFN